MVNVDVQIFCYNNFVMMHHNKESNLRRIKENADIVIRKMMDNWLLDYL